MSKVSAQPFAWEYKPRLPIEFSKEYLAIGLTSSYQMINSDISVYDNSIFCCNYQSGNGYTIGLDFAYSQWFESTSKLALALKLTNSSNSFSINNTYPRRNMEALVTQSDLDINTISLNLNPTYSYRILTSDFYAKAGFGINLNLSSKYKVIEKIISPSNETFLQLNSKERIVVEDNFEDYKAINFDINLGIEYLYDLGTEKYLNIYLLYSPALTNHLSTGKLKLNTINLGINYNFKK
jgi:hypothetical protein